MVAALEAARSPRDLFEVRRDLLAFRRLYLRAETTLDFFADAVSTRLSRKMSAYLRACDSLAHRGMAAVLEPLDKPVPVALTYVDKGLGASLLRAGMRLWDGTENPVAAIKITRHNLHRPTSIVHEIGHQVDHVLGWNAELAAALQDALAATPQLAHLWSTWAPEIAADAHAFVHTGYASVAALHDVVAGEESHVFRFIRRDPHPIAFLRVLLGIEMCRQHFGAGPWDEIEWVWTRQHRVERAGAVAHVLRASVPIIPRVVAIVLDQPMRAFRGRPLTAIVDPRRVAPAALKAMEARLQTALYTSAHWVWSESMRTLALLGLELATQPSRTAEILRRQDQWMTHLAGTLQAA